MSRVFRYMKCVIKALQPLFSIMLGKFEYSLLVDEAMAVWCLREILSVFPSYTTQKIAGEAVFKGQLQGQEVLLISMESGMYSFLYILAHTERVGNVRLDKM